MKGVLPWLVRCACSAAKRDFILPGLLWAAQYKICFPHRTLFQFMCPHRPANWAGSRAGPPVSECVSPKGVGPSTTLAWPGWKQPDIAVEVDTARLETSWFKRCCVNCVLLYYLQEPK